MTKKALINKTLKTISQLPQDKIREINDFADFMLKKYDEEVLRKGIERLASDSKAFDFLEEEKQQEQEQEQEQGQDGQELYLPEDLKEQYN